MKVASTNHTLKEGTNILIREAKASDSKSFILCVKSYLKSNFIPFGPEEYQLSLDEHQEWIRKFLKSKNDLLLVAEYEGQIIGNIDLSTHNRSMLKHTGIVGMGIHENWQNKGIGTILLDKVIEWSDNNSNVEILWLQVFGNNEGGIKLYKKNGFQEDGRQVNFIKTPSGAYVDNVIMTRKRQ